MMYNAGTKYKRRSEGEKDLVVAESTDAGRKSWRKSEVGSHWWGGRQDLLEVNTSSRGLDDPRPPSRQVPPSTALECRRYQAHDLLAACRL